MNIIKFIIKKIYKLLDWSKDTEIADFPFYKDSITGFKKPFLEINKNEGFYTRYYEEHVEDCSEINNFYHLHGKHLFANEIIWAKNIYNKKFTIDIDENCLLPISGTASINQVIDIKVDKDIKSLKINTQRFTHLKFIKGEKVEISSKKDFLIGNKINLNTNQKKKHKLVLLLFVDGLYDFENLGLGEMSSIMPNTYKYFSKGTIFKNHRANADWTLASFPSIFSGGYSHNHKFFHPRRRHEIGVNSDTLGQLFSKKNYHTFQVGGGWRMNPEYGFSKGFERSIYQREIDAKEVISHFFENYHTFKDRDQFVWLNFNDLHHYLKTIPSIFTQSKMSHNYLENKSERKVKSVFTKYNNTKKETLENEMTKLDFHLGILFNFIENNFLDKEILVNLVTDHGHAFLDKSNNILSVARNSIPWFIRGDGVDSQKSHELTENVDIFETIVNKCELDKSNVLSNGNLPFALGGTEARSYTFAQSIFPGQKYKSVIKDNKYEFFFETRGSVDEQGYFEKDPYNCSLQYLNSSEKVENEELFEKYKHKCLEYMSLWLNSL